MLYEHLVLNSNLVLIFIYYLLFAELFGIRISGKDDEQGSRFLSFGALIEAAHGEILAKNYKS